jgi:hypothetical protein
MLSQNLLAKRLNLALPNDFHASPLEPKIEATDSRKK